MLVRILAASLAMLALNGCAKRTPVAAPAPVPVPIAPVRTAAPLPPDGAAANLTVPARLPDGSYATPNRSPSPAAALWHLRAAFNVAALNCSDAALAPAYNRLLTAHRAALTGAHRDLSAQLGQAAFDPAMTRLYNYFALPPVTARFCAAAGPLLQQAAALAPGTLAEFAPAALAAIDRPFADFYARYDQYRADRAAWQAGTLTQPRLTYDRTVFAGNDRVSGGSARYAGR
jgi:hypothetical protein